MSNSSGNNTSTQATNASTNQYLKVNYNNSIKDLLVPTKDTLDQLKESGVVYSAKKLETGTNLNTDLSKTDSFNFDGSTETGTLGVTGTLPIEHGGTGNTTRDLALTALSAGGSGSTDANIVASGTYVLTTETASNLPPEPGYYLLSVFRYHTSDLTCGQIAIKLDNGNLYSRDYVTGVWKDWVCCSSRKIDTILIPNGANLDDYRDKGFYASNGSSNSIVNVPSDLGTGAFELVVTGIDADGLYCTQWLKSYERNIIWVRTQVSSKKPWVWRNWERIIMDTTPVLNLNSIELGKFLSSTDGHGGYLDFHFNGSTADYTTRIIEAQSGRLNVEGNFDVKGWLQSSHGFWMSGGGFYASDPDNMIYGTSLPAAGEKGRIFFKKV